ncbi:hypothetical protein [Nonomuraea sp. NPDC050540]|uniref:hypothetical protein n=1 Tax=Nonomuraea sp. NPDC050540 TaxID=3364367 RepID=UPI0037A75884
MTGKVPFDVAAYHERVQGNPCFICAIVAGDPAYDVEKVFYEDERHLAFLARYATLPGATPTCTGTWRRCRRAFRTSGSNTTR